jgi:hypothetical protein
MSEANKGFLDCFTPKMYSLRVNPVTPTFFKTIYMVVEKTTKGIQFLNTLCC